MTYDEVTLHVGLPKTGTTTIQWFLDANRQNLLKRHISCAGPLTLQDFPMTPGFWEEDRLGRGLQELKDRATNDRAKRIIWSNEGLSSYPFVRDGKCPAIVKRELPAHRYRVVIYLRRQDHRMRSGYLQSGIMCKDHPGPVLPFDDWLRWRCGEHFEHMQVADIDYASLIQPWADLFGSDSIVVRVFEKSQLLHGNLLHDFCEAAELPTQDCTFDVPNRNVSFNMELYEMLKMYNSVFEDAHYSDEMTQFIQRHATDKFFSMNFFTHFALPPETRLDILERCEPSNRQIAKEFLGRDDGVLFREPWPSANEAYEPFAGLTTEKIVPIFLHLLQKHDQAIVDLSRRVGRFEQEAKHLGITRDVVRAFSWLGRKLKSLISSKKTADDSDTAIEPHKTFREPSNIGGRERPVHETRSSDEQDATIPFATRTRTSPSANPFSRQPPSGTVKRAA